MPGSCSRRWRSACARRRAASSSRAQITAACLSCGAQNLDGARFCSNCGSGLTAPAPELRKTVTIVRCDLTGSTALGERLDPETLRGVVNRYFEAMRAVLERHGGMVEKFVGDAVMAVFGVPQVYEDDALRAVKAAAEMRFALARLNEELEPERGVLLQMRMGVNTGEVLAGDPSAGQAFVSGDAANVAARLEQAAAAGDILLGEATYRLVSGAVEADPLDDLTVKGKTERLAAYRLVAVREGAEAIPRRLETPLVGRHSELERLTAEYERARDERACRTITVVGEPGIGKSRLAEELIARIQAEATVLRGRCLPYGEGITYWPLFEMLRSAAHHEARVRIMELLQGEPDAELIADRLSTAVGAADAAGTSEEIAWASRKLFERLARERPLGVLVDDLQWAEETFFDLLEHVALLSRSAPILLLCLARPELVEERPSWPGERVRLEPFSGEESEQMLEALGAAVPEDARARITEAAEGNPLFLEQMLAIANADEDEVVVPPTLQALLAARLDRLEPDERRTIECAAVVGQEFWDGAVRELMEDSAPPRLLGLVRKELVEPAESTFTGEDAFRFVHLLVRDAAYAALPKRRRANLHARLADWLERKDAELGVVHDEIVGYHFEQAFRYRTELGSIDPESRALGLRAGEHLAAAGRRADAKGDTPAAVNLLTRAADLLPRDSRLRFELLPDLGAALEAAGQLDAARAPLEEAAATAPEPIASHAAVQLWHLRLQTDLAITPPEARRHVEAAIPMLETHGDERGLARAWLMLGDVANWADRRREMEAAAARSADYAARAGDGRAEAEALRLFGGALVYGPTPAQEGIALLEERLARERPDGMREAAIIAPLAALKAMRGDFAEARHLLRRAESVYEELGLTLQLARLGFMTGQVESRAGDLGAAECGLRRGCDLLRGIGEKGRLSGMLHFLAAALCDLEKIAETEEALRDIEQLLGFEEAMTDYMFKSVRSRILARRGDRGALELARAASREVSSTDASARGEVFRHLAEVESLVGSPREAAHALREAVKLYEAKGDVVFAAKARNLLDELGQARAPGPA